VGVPYQEYHSRTQQIPNRKFKINNTLELHQSDSIEEVNSAGSSHLAGGNGGGMGGPQQNQLLYKGTLRVTTMTGAKKKATLKQQSTTGGAGAEQMKPFITVDEEYHLPQQ
jgi:hypothetical protein